VGAQFAIQLNTIDGVNYGYNFKVTDVNWSTKTITLADLKIITVLGVILPLRLMRQKLTKLR
jgi:hypothetical protein